MYNTSSSFNGILPSGEQIWFGCEQGFYPIEPVVSTCQEDGLWYPDPNKLVCQSKQFAHCHYGTISLRNNYVTFRGVHTPCELNQLRT